MCSQFFFRTDRIWEIVSEQSKTSVCSVPRNVVSGAWSKKSDLCLESLSSCRHPCQCFCRKYWCAASTLIRALVLILATTSHLSQGEHTKIQIENVRLTSLFANISRFHKQVRMHTHPRVNAWTKRRLVFCVWIYTTGVWTFDFSVFTAKSNVTSVQQTRPENCSRDI